MVPIDPTTWMPIVYPAAADEGVKLLCEAINPEHSVFNGKRQHDRCIRHCNYSFRLFSLHQRTLAAAIYVGPQVELQAFWFAQQNGIVRRAFTDVALYPAMSLGLAISVAYLAATDGSIILILVAPGTVAPI